MTYSVVPSTTLDETLRVDLQLFFPQNVSIEWFWTVNPPTKSGIVNNKLTIWWRSWHSKTFRSTHLVREIRDTRGEDLMCKRRAGGRSPHGGLRALYQKSTCLHEINFRVLCGANLVSSPSSGGLETFAVRRIYLKERINWMVLESQLPPTNSSTYHFLPLIKAISWRSCGGVDIWKPFNQ